MVISLDIFYIIKALFSTKTFIFRILITKKGVFFINLYKKTKWNTIAL